MSSKPISVEAIGPMRPPDVIEIGVIGERFTAYDVAVRNGFQGSESQWLVSLVGPRGLSAYAVAVENGFSGSESQWLASLIGPRGNPGPRGFVGPSGGPVPSGGTDGQAVVKDGPQEGAVRWDDAPDVGWDDVTGKPSTFPPASHNHSAGQITSGTLDVARLPAIYPPAPGVTSGTSSVIRTHTQDEEIAGTTGTIPLDPDRTYFVVVEGLALVQRVAGGSGALPRFRSAVHGHDVGTLVNPPSEEGIARSVCTTTVSGQSSITCSLRAEIPDTIHFTSRSRSLFATATVIG